MPPLLLELPPEAAKMSGEEVYYLGEQLLIRGQSLQAAAFLARAAGLSPSMHAYDFLHVACGAGANDRWAFFLKKGGGLVLVLVF